MEPFDVVIVGAGLSGVAAACHLQKSCPGKSHVILEARGSIGGTWDLFRYPGVRSDSDMFTLGYSFRPWQGPKAIARGESIRDYIQETAREHGVDRRIRFGFRVRRASWSNRDAAWTVEAEQAGSGKPVTFACRFLFLCTGYYRYESGHAPAFPGAERFQGRIVHPQAWPGELDYTGGRVVVIGSGATAVTLVPAMAERAAHVTMLQRSPSYVLAVPDGDPIGNALRKVLPARWVLGPTRWGYILLALAIYQVSRRCPGRARKILRDQARDRLGPDYDIDTHFTPAYDPWDQRLCFAPDGDLFRVIREGRASVVTGHIDTFTEQGLRLRSGEELRADIIVTATGLDMLAFGGIEIRVDGEVRDPGEAMSYKGMMLCDVPNLAFAMGYINQSWTLKCELTCEHVCRLLRYMDRRGYRACMPRNDDPSQTRAPLFHLSSGYVTRRADRFPKQGSRVPWRAHQNYLLDIASQRWARVDHRVMTFSR